MHRPLWLVVYGAALLALVFFVLAVAALRGRRRVGGIVDLVAALLLLAVAGLSLAVALGTHGYLALTREVTACTIDVTPLGHQAFRADVTLADGTRHEYTLQGDELYVDARILKWHPAVNLLGLHTGYRLDRIAGRYASIDDERTSTHTVYALADAPSVDLFGAVRRYGFLQPLVDARYGSGTFVPIEGGGTFEVRVSTTGLLVRQAGGRPAEAPSSR